jgi:hypothetical protein
MQQSQLSESMNFFYAYPSTLSVDRVIRVPGDVKVSLCRINVWTDRAVRTYPATVKTLLARFRQ